MDARMAAFGHGETKPMSGEATVAVAQGSGISTQQSHRLCGFSTSGRITSGYAYRHGFSHPGELWRPVRKSWCNVQISARVLWPYTFRA